MFLTFEDKEEIHEMEIRRGSRELPEGITGIRILNRIILGEKYFNHFIQALTIDDFEAVREIFKNVIDHYTQELPYEESYSQLLIGPECEKTV